MSITYERLANESLSALSFVKELYENTFPKEERRDWNSFLLLLAEPNMQLDLIKDNELAVGFLISWKFDGCVFIEHFAISPTVRGRGYGGVVMLDYLKTSGGKVILEVEPPISADAARRISFYEKLGLIIIDVTYRQPSYDEQDVSYPMYLMGTPEIKERSDLAKLIAEIKQKVYFC